MPIVSRPFVPRTAEQLQPLRRLALVFGMLISGAGVLYLAHLVDWQTAYHTMACLSAFAVF